MARITEAFVEISARTGRLERGLRRSQGITRNFARTAGRDFGRLGSIIRRFVAGPLAALTGLLTAGALIRGFRGIIEQADRLDKVSKRLGITTTELQKLEFAAKQTGIGQRELELALQRMTRRLGEASKGMGEARPALAELGLDAAELVKLSPDKQFDRIAKAIAGVTNPSQRLALAFKFFDTEGVKLVQLINEGADGIDALKRRAVEIGAVISSDTVRSAVQLKDAISEVGSAARGLGAAVFGLVFGNGVIAAAFREIASLMGKLTNQIVVNADAIRGIFGETFRFMVQSLAVAIKQMEILFLEFRGFISENVFQPLARALVDLLRGLGLSDATIATKILPSIQALQALIDPARGLREDQIAELERELARQLALLGVSADRIKAFVASIITNIRFGIQPTPEQLRQFGIGGAAARPGGLTQQLQTAIGAFKVGQKTPELKELEDTAQNTKDTADNTKNMVARLDALIALADENAFVFGA